ncbi:response regulator transcription factor [Reichenbachiella sp. MSK19-1]|uniref:response regulator transcription factor n=1 Tax=Reichenbachiella sp. MSK19-1 TaxID=1897631 RepID=UPI000E6C1CBB|nr:response regulator transcription factor [Reichenbachiella sp. MSK19-1]RJE73201.1 DNA-binding response regulator [Reichenbachiella sp. MSK19-1]
MTRILVVDDEPAMREGLHDNLIFEGYQVDTASDGSAALAALKDQHYDLMVLDVMMPEMSGFDVCKQLRSEQNPIPIILLTAKGEEIDRVLGLEFGADDYISKPFSVRELVARIKAILRRTQQGQQTAPPQHFEQIGLMQVDFKTYEAKLGSETIKLSHREFEVLHFLWNHRQQIVSRDDLLKNIWGYDEFPTTRTIDNFILRLRQKIENNPNDPKIILTVHGMGYKML